MSSASVLPSHSRPLWCLLALAVALHPVTVQAADQIVWRHNYLLSIAGMEVGSETAAAYLAPDVRAATLYGEAFVHLPLGRVDLTYRLRLRGPDLRLEHYACQIRTASGAAIAAATATREGIQVVERIGA